MEETVDPNQEQFKKLHFRMYEEKFPKEHELVYVSKYKLFMKNSAK